MSNVTRVGVAGMPPVRDEPWRQQAACAGRNPVMWDPADGPATEVHVRRWALGAQICLGCPVVDACAADVTRADAGTIRAGGLVGEDGRIGPIRRSALGRPPKSPAVSVR